MQSLKSFVCVVPRTIKRSCNETTVTKLKNWTNNR